MIGAGLAGMTVSSTLEDHADVLVFEKSRGVGGRMATRYTEHFQFDHGAPFFTAHSTDFRQFLQPYITSGTVSEWRPRIITLDGQQHSYSNAWDKPRYVATPKMNSLCNALKDSERLHLNTRIERIQYRQRQWLLHDQHNESHGPFDGLITTIPGPQAADIIPEAFDGYAILAGCRMHSCYSLMLGCNKTLDIDWQLAAVRNSPVEWIVVDSAKPGRTPGCALLVHTSRAWAKTHIHDDRDTVQSILLQELERLLNMSLTSPDYIQLHSWLYAGGGLQAEAACLFDHRMQLGVCGDWLIDGDVESAFLSARALASKFI